MENRCSFGGTARHVKYLRIPTKCEHLDASPQAGALVNVGEPCQFRAAVAMLGRRRANAGTSSCQCRGGVVAIRVGVG